MQSHYGTMQNGKISSNYNTFFTKRFDRENGERIHFASAMTARAANNYEDTIRDNPASYLDLAPNCHLQKKKKKSNEKPAPCESSI